MLYWASAIIINENNKKPKLYTTNMGEFNFDKAMTIIDKLKENNIVLSAWIDVFDKDNIRKTVYHDCFVDIFGNLTYCK